MKDMSDAVQVRLEQSRMERQNCTLVLNKSLLLYFFFLAAFFEDPAFALPLSDTVMAST